MSDENKNNIDNIKDSFSSSYDASAVGGDLGLKGIRLSPAQYLGSRGSRGAVQAAIEIIQNSVDEASAFINHYLDAGVPFEEIANFIIDITITKDDRVIIEDTGRGVPVGISEKFKMPAIEAAFEFLNVGGKGRGYVDKAKTAYKGKTIGKHGSGSACVNATSEYFFVDTFLMANGEHHRVEYAKAEKTKPTFFVEKSPEGKHGTRVEFKPDTEVFDLYDEEGKKVERFYNYDKFIAIIKEYAYNTDKIVYNLKLENSDGSWREVTIKSDEHHPVSRLRPYVEGEIYQAEIIDEELNFSLVIHAGLSSSRETFQSCNMVPLKGGTHIMSVTEALNTITSVALVKINATLETMKSEIRNLSANQLAKYGILLPSQMVSMYLVLTMADPDYSSQAKDYLDSPKIKQPITDMLTQALDGQLAPLKQKLTNRMFDIAMSIIEAQEALKKEQERKKKMREDRERRQRLMRPEGEIEGTGSDERSVIHAAFKDHRKVNLFLTEGLSAEGTIAAARNKNFDTILPIESRPPNVLNHTDAQLEKMPKYRLLFKYFFKMYNSVILATDPDPDGDYMRMLIMMFLYKHPELRQHYLLGGRVFNLRLPKAVGKRGEQVLLFYSMEERFEHQNKTTESWEYYTHKGVGSIDVETLRVILEDKNSYEKFDPTTIHEGIKIVERFLTDTRFKKNYILAKYGSSELYAHAQKRSSIIRYHEVDYDIETLDDQFVDTADLSEIRRKTELELMMENGVEEINYDKSLTANDLDNQIVIEALDLEVDDLDSIEGDDD